jgi:hypothetical protein
MTPQINHLAFLARFSFLAKVILSLGFVFHLCLSAAQGRAASSVGGFSLAMSSAEIETFARTKLGLKIEHSDESLGLYRQGDDPDRTIPLAFFSYGDDGKIACMHFHLDIFSAKNVFTRDLLRILQAIYGVERFRRRKLLGYPVVFHGHTKFGEHVSVHSSNKTTPSWIIICSPHAKAN